MKIAGDRTPADLVKRLAAHDLQLKIGLLGMRLEMGRTEAVDRA